MSDDDNSEFIEYEPEDLEAYRPSVEEAQKAMVVGGMMLAPIEVLSEEGVSKYLSITLPLNKPPSAHPAILAGYPVYISSFIIDYESLGTIIEALIYTRESMV